MLLINIIFINYEDFINDKKWKLINKKLCIKNKKIDLWQEHITQLAAFDNLSCKVSGMVTEANWDNWKFTDLVPYLDVITNTFGTNRLLFGSDWPVCLLGGSYEEILQIVATYFEPFSQDEKEAIFYKNAQAIYQIDEQ